MFECQYLEIDIKLLNGCIVAYDFYRSTQLYHVSAVIKGPYYFAHEYIASDDLYRSSQMYYVPVLIERDIELLLGSIVSDVFFTHTQMYYVSMLQRHIEFLHGNIVFVELYGST